MGKRGAGKMMNKKAKAARKRKPEPAPYEPPPGVFMDKYAPGGAAGYIPTSMGRSGRLPAGA